MKVNRDGSEDDGLSTHRSIGTDTEEDEFGIGLSETSGTLGVGKEDAKCRLELS